ncbi:LysR family transcriptional regulator ArgP [Paracoccus tegillarcae]|uniref:ArgP/LysG family DNA-binding transcriptional regulator n=1 Tax=Paracoccus tegillarcae TaxID=1529068 RepID=A0A2K9EZ16_9RHOB|nr:LysR family transcriptional regulator ArgP [Paracoccus tegillarcae]AUH32131.1 ArgP/LysG family DNA-binding transcriptional regulator [Paracoccus tegillarcae]
MLDYPALAALAQVIRTGSFEGAAAALGVTQSAISQRIKTLEERTGAVLIHRGPPPEPTEQGARLIAHYDQVMLLEADLHGASGPQPVIRVAVNADSLATWAMPALAAAPGLLDLVIDDQDHADQWLRAGQVAAAITADPGPVPGCDSFPLGAMRYLAGASEDFMARHFPNGPTPQALSRAPMLTFNTKDALQLRWLRQVTGRRLSPPPPTHLIPSTQAFVSAARLGVGWGMNPEDLHCDPADGGPLVALFPDHPLDIPLHWQVARIAAGPLAPLTRAIRAAAARALRPIDR